MRSSNSGQRQSVNIAQASRLRLKQFPTIVGIPINLMEAGHRRWMFHLLLLSCRKKRNNKTKKPVKDEITGYNMSREYVYISKRN
jgi:hypothetical protein